MTVGKLGASYTILYILYLICKSAKIRIIGGQIVLDKYLPASFILDGGEQWKIGQVLIDFLFVSGGVEDDKPLFIAIQHHFQDDLALPKAVIKSCPYKDCLFCLLVGNAKTHAGGLAVLVRDAFGGHLYDPLMDAEVDLIRAVDGTAFHKMDGVFGHCLRAKTVF